MATATKAERRGRRVESQNGHAEKNGHAANGRGERGGEDLGEALSVAEASQAVERFGRALSADNRELILMARPENVDGELVELAAGRVKLWGPGLPELTADEAGLVVTHQAPARSKGRLLNAQTVSRRNTLRWSTVARRLKELEAAGRFAAAGPERSAEGREPDLIGLYAQAVALFGGCYGAAGVVSRARAAGQDPAAALAKRAAGMAPIQSRGLHVYPEQAGLRLAQADPAIAETLPWERVVERIEATSYGVPPGATSTTTPAGIAAHDPEAAGNGHGGKIRNPKSEIANRQSPIENLPATIHDLPLAAIRPSPYQTRQDWDEAELAELAESLKTHGQLQAVVVRPIRLADKVRADQRASFQRYELVAGERRWRAAKLAGLSTVRAEVRDLSDAAAAELTIVENLQRRDLNPIEEARGYQRLLELSNCTQQDLAARVKRSQGEISHRLSLLKLPEAWQRRVMSRDMSATHARLLAPWADRPAVLAAVEEFCFPARRGKQAAAVRPAPPSVPEWEQAIEDAVKGETEPLQRIVRMPGRYETGTVQVPKKHPRWAELDAVEVTVWGRQQWRAFNRELAKELLDDLERAWRAKHKQPAATGATAGTSRADRRKDLQIEKAAAAGQLREWTQAWLQDLCALQLFQRAETCSVEDMAKCLLWAVASDADLVDDAVRDELGGYRAGAESRQQTLARLLADGTGPLWGRLQRMCRQVLTRAPGSADGRREPPGTSSRIVGELSHTLLLGRWLGVRPAKSWEARDDRGRQVFAGDRTAALWDLLGDETLAEVAAEWGLEDEGLTRESFDAQLAQPRKKSLPLPFFVAEVLAEAEPQRKSRGGRV